MPLQLTLREEVVILKKEVKTLKKEVKTLTEEIKVSYKQPKERSCKCAADCVSYSPWWI